VTFALSDLVRGLVVLSVHPRQAEVAPGAAKAFGFSIPAGVHETDMPKYLGNVRCWVNSGKHLLALRFSGFAISDIGPSLVNIRGRLSAVSHSPSGSRLLYFANYTRLGPFGGT